MRECENKPVSFLRSHRRSQAHEDSLPPESFPAMLHSHTEFPRRRLFFLQNYLKMGSKSDSGTGRSNSVMTRMSCIYGALLDVIYMRVKQISPPTFPGKR